MCMTHRYARSLNADGGIVYSCVACRHQVDWTAAREEYDRLHRSAGDPAPEVVQYDPTAGLIETPAGLAKFVAYDAIRQTATVEVDHRYLVEYPANECYIPVPIGGRGAA